ncbi:MAG: hypothetical protein WC520_01545 [Candidatus Paceibacterota bacterium]
MKKIGKIVLLILIFAGGFAMGLAGKFYIDEWKARRNVALWMESLDPFKNDKYGGKTPEETFDLYLSALKKGDLELASRYFYPTKQEGELESLKEMRTNGELIGYIEELSSVKKEDWKKEEFNGQLTIKYDGYRSSTRTTEVVNDKLEVVRQKMQIGHFDNVAIFSQNNIIWKIYSL